MLKKHSNNYIVISVKTKLLIIHTIPTSKTKKKFKNKCIFVSTIYNSRIMFCQLVCLTIIQCIQLEESNMSVYLCTYDCLFIWEHFWIIFFFLTENLWNEANKSICQWIFHISNRCNLNKSKCRYFKQIKPQLPQVTSYHMLIFIISDKNILIL